MRNEKVSRRYGRYQPLNHLVEEDETLFPSALLERWQLEGLQHLGDGAGVSGLVVASNKTGGEALYSFESVYVLLEVWTPYNGSILKGWSDEGEESVFLTLGRAEAQISTEETKGAMGFLAGVGDVGAPLQVVRDLDA